MHHKRKKERIYLIFNYHGAVTESKTLLTGIHIGKNDDLYISGFYEPSNGNTISFLYKGDITGKRSLFQ